MEFPPCRKHQQVYNMNGMKEWIHTSYSKIDERNKHWHLMQCIVAALEGCMEELKEWERIQRYRQNQFAKFFSVLSESQTVFFTVLASIFLENSSKDWVVVRVKFQRDTSLLNNTSIIRPMNGQGTFIHSLCSGYWNLICC